MTEPTDLDYVVVEDLFTLTFVVGEDGVARWTGEVVPLPALVRKAPGPAIADLVRILTDPSLDPTPETNP